MSGKYILNKKHEERRICMDKSASNHNQENYIKELVSNHCCDTSHKETLQCIQNSNLYRNDAYTHNGVSEK